jgi:hypothetical protein
VGNQVILTIEAKCSALPSASATERLEMFNFGLNQWTVVSEQTGSTTDRQTVITRNGKYIEPGTNKLKIRISWLDRGVASLNWRGSIDWIHWDVSP